ncbi:hypothetical protein B0J18DRAFT_302133 [Chaetomium sp. MPI-SDFR-AT-0129]|nr:hypothetical protein B0J18DRAFT_302133 [Chaetomium sp. MPI-SDFR-AT-0129]
MPNVTRLAVAGQPRPRDVNKFTSSLEHTCVAQTRSSPARTRHGSSAVTKTRCLAHSACCRASPSQVSLIAEPPPCSLHSSVPEPGFTSPPLDLNSLSRPGPLYNSAGSTVYPYARCVLVEGGFSDLSDLIYYPDLPVFYPSSLQEVANTMRPCIAYWCPLRRGFRRGPTWVTYASGVKQLEEGFQILWLGDICVYDGTCWKIGNTTMSIYEFGEAVMATDPNDSLEAALLSMNDAPFPLGDDAALLSFLRLPTISHPLLFQLGSLAQNRRRAQRIPCNDAQKHPKRVRKLVAWRFDSTTVGDELQRIIILTEWVRGSDEKHRTLSWEPESKLHAVCKPLLLAFWRRGGGRDSSIRIRGGRLGTSS